MSKFIFIILAITFALYYFYAPNFDLIGSGAPPYDESYDEPGDDQFAWLRNWSRPDGPPKVALQVGHWKNDELPEELARLRGNTGSSGGGKSEWEVNLAIAEAASEILKKKGIIVDILPATIPPRYWADVFVAIHADGSLDNKKTGFKLATPRRDVTGYAQKLLEEVSRAYAQVTKLEEDPNVTRNMRGYYAFSWWRREHAVHPMTASIILETGFLTSPSDRKIILSPELPAEGIANGVIEYLKGEGLLQ